MQQQMVKRDGQVVLCEVQKIIDAIEKAANAAGQNVDAKKVATLVLSKVKEMEKVGVEHIQDLVEETLMEHAYQATAKAYILYRKDRERVREGKA